jgi:hypothetical protein
MHQRIIGEVGGRGKIGGVEVVGDGFMIRFLVHVLVAAACTI